MADEENGAKECPLKWCLRVPSMAHTGNTSMSPLLQARPDFSVSYPCSQCTADKMKPYLFRSTHCRAYTSSRPSLLLVLRAVWVGSVCSCHDDPCLPQPRRPTASLVGLAAGTVVAGIDHAGVYVGCGIVVLVRIQAMSRAQNVVGILGLPGSIARGCCIACGRGTADGATISAAAGGPVLIVPPCGLGLIPISSIVQIYALSR